MTRPTKHRFRIKTVIGTNAIMLRMQEGGYDAILLTLVDEEIIRAKIVGEGEWLVMGDAMLSHWTNCVVMLANTKMTAEFCAKEIMAIAARVQAYGMPVGEIGEMDAMAIDGEE